jgi:hypothetical protein
MSLNRIEDDGELVQCASGQSTIRPRCRIGLSSIENKFYGTSVYSTKVLDHVPAKEVSRLFRRMRAELEDIAHDFAQEQESSPGDNYIRTDILFEMLVASEFLADELDSDIARLCFAGFEAERNESAEQKEHVRKSVEVFSTVRNRLSKFQRELDSKIGVTLRIFQRYSVSASLDFDPFIHQQQGGRPFLMQFLQAIDETIGFLSQLSYVALEARDFESFAELSSCIVRLLNFSNDAKRISFQYP